MIVKTGITTILSSLFLLGSFLNAQEISEVNYLGQAHFKIETASATYLYDRAGGGFSSLRDSTGLEWIGFKPGNGQVPQSASADFRGLPNLVFRGEDNGAGHPGFDKCVSELVARDRIRTWSISGKWEWQWTFYEQGALLEIVRTDSTRNYWFLYEGIPGGAFEPGKQYWGTSSDGHRTDTPPMGSDQSGRGFWEWAYFGHQNIGRCFFVAHLTPDKLTDNFSYMGSGPEGIGSPDGMVVFGLGRDGATPLMRGANKFFIGFLEYGRSEEELPGMMKRHLSLLGL